MTRSIPETEASDAPRPPADAVIEVRSITRRFGDVQALRDVSLRVDRGEIHALLGPNGAGKTTLLRILSGLVEAEQGEIRVLGIPWRDPPRHARHLFGLVPSGDRSFYLRISGFENLVFFARLQGLRRSEARDRALAGLRLVGLEDAAHRKVLTYSHGMQKRLSVARGLMMDPPLLFVDEATHDLDPAGARRVRDLVEQAARRGVAVVWATQRIEEIRGFARSVTVLDRGAVRFEGTVAQLLAAVPPERFVLQVKTLGPVEAVEAVRRRLGDRAVVAAREGDEDHVLIGLRPGTTLGAAVALLVGAGIDVIACREERPELEQAFLSLIEPER